MVSVIASSVRKGNVLEKDGKLYLVLTAENIHPGKGTPVTHLEMRRISDGVKRRASATTDSVEKAFIEEQTYNYLYHDGDTTVHAPPRLSIRSHVGQDVVGDCAPYLTENMEVQLQSLRRHCRSRSKFPSAPRLKWWRPNR